MAGDPTLFASNVRTGNLGGFGRSYHGLIIEAAQRLENNIQELLPVLASERDSPEWLAEKQRMVDEFFAEVDSIEMAAGFRSLTPYSTWAMSASTRPPAVQALEWNTPGPGTLPTQPQPLYTFLHQQTSQTWKQATASPIPTASLPPSLNTKSPQSNSKTVSTNSGGRYAEETLAEDGFYRFDPMRPLRLENPITEKESGPPPALRPRPQIWTPTITQAEDALSEKPRDRKGFGVRLPPFVQSPAAPFATNPSLNTEGEAARRQREKERARTVNLGPSTAREQPPRQYDHVSEGPSSLAIADSSPALPSSSPLQIWTPPMTREEDAKAEKQRFRKVSRSPSANTPRSVSTSSVQRPEKMRPRFEEAQRVEGEHESEREYEKERGRSVGAHQGKAEDMADEVVQRKETELLSQQQEGKGDPRTEEPHGSLVPPVETLVTQRFALTIRCLLGSWKLRQDLLLVSGDQISKVKHVIEQVESQIVEQFTDFLDCDSEGASSVANGLKRKHSQTFINIIHEVLNWGTLPDAALRRKGRRLLQKVTQAQEQLPSSLFIEGVSDHDQDPSFHGGFGDVFQALYQNRAVALKRIRMFTADHATSERHRLALYKEALIWQGLHHEFVLPLLGIDCSTFAPAFTMVSPWMKNGTVLKYLKERGPGDLDRLLLEIAQGLAYLHSVDVIHGDLRGTNILISDEEHACLSDFGLATIVPDSLATNTSSSNHAGSVRWFAPELFDPERFGCQRTVRTTATDVYAYAVVCIELYTGAPPFSQLSDGAVLFQILQGMRPQRPPSMSTALFELVTSAWAADFRTRPTSRELVASLQGLVAGSSLST
ncbi:kinase-like domain-containing protein [Favolaschia claudopus]|uniref:Kinase-like domain-containing protein n=1 Tax=Favolaschia claudopus TaxID=2862362 RepID=A0AAW0D5I8_9AGAR